MPIRVLTASDVRRALPMRQAIHAMREAFETLAEGRAVMPHRTIIKPPGWDTTSLSMPAALTAPRRMGTKLLTLNSGNPKRGLPVIHGLVVMFDPDTGAPVGLIEGTSLTALRTGAVSALATDLLALSYAESVAVIGAGAQAASQLEAICAVRHIARATIWSRSLENATRLADRVRGRPGFPVDVTAAPTVEAAADGVDIICTATPATEPLLRLEQVKPGVHVNAIGSYKPDMRELSADLVVSARIVVDDREAAMAEAGELIAAVSSGLIEAVDFVQLGDLVTGRAEGRTSEDQVTVFKSVGLAVQDLCAADRALGRAQLEGIGLELDLAGGDG